MTIYARHFSTMRFSREEFAAMPVVHRSDDCPPYGFSRTLDSAGKALVVYFPPEDGRVAYAVRPIIVVPSRPTRQNFGALEIVNRAARGEWKLRAV